MTDYDISNPDHRHALRLLVLHRFIKACEANGLDWIEELARDYSPGEADDNR